jgi:uncharacterized protein YkvS
MYSTSFGKELSWKYPKVIKTEFGTMASLWTAVSYCTHKGFPYMLTNKDPSKITPKQREIALKNKVNVSNYWSIVADLTGIRLLNDSDLRKQLGESVDKKLTSYTSKPVIMFGKPVGGNVARVNDNMVVYLLILAYYRDLIANNEFNNSKVHELALALRDNADIGIYDGVKDICVENYKTTHTANSNVEHTTDTVTE